MFALSASPSAMADVGQTDHHAAACRTSRSAVSLRPPTPKLSKELSATTEEYSDCASLIRQAQRAGASGKQTGAGTQTGAAATPTGAIAATPTEQRAIAHAAQSGSAPVSLGSGDVVHPGVVHADIASAFSTLPGSLLAVLVIMLAALLAFGGAILRKRARDGRSD